MRKLFSLPHLEAAKNQNSFWGRQLVRQRWENVLFDCSFLRVSFNFAVVASSRLDITPRFKKSDQLIGLRCRFRASNLSRLEMLPMTTDQLNFLTQDNRATQ